jgi:glutaredoxin-related protein
MPSHKSNTILFIENYRQNNIVDNKTNQLIKVLLNYLSEDDYINYYKIFKCLPEVKNWCKNPNSYVQGVFPGVLNLVIENGTIEEFKELFEETEYGLYDTISDCAFYGKLSMLKHIIQSNISIDNMTLSNSLYFALHQKHYDIVEYFLERNVNNILVYDYIVKNKECSSQCEYLFNTYGEKMKVLYE